MTQTAHRAGRASARVRPQPQEKRRTRPLRGPRSPKHAAESDLNTARSKRGLALYKSHAPHIWAVESESYRVPSQNGAGIYQVRLKPGAEHCTCPDYARHGSRNRREPGSFFCKHLYAALLYQINHDSPAILGPQPARPEPATLARAS